MNFGGFWFSFNINQKRKLFNKKKKTTKNYDFQSILTNYKKNLRKKALEKMSLTSVLQPNGLQINLVYNA